MDLEAARAAMIDSQVRPNDVTDHRLIMAMASVAREAFIPASRKAVAYADIAIETLPGRWMMQPRDFAKLIQVAGVQATDRVLDIAAGTGYSSVVLSRVAASVVALEDDPAAARALEGGMAGAIPNITVVSGPLKAGAPGHAPFDVIFVNGAVEEVPKAWTDQLAEGGRLAVVVAEGHVRRARIYARAGGKTAWRTPFDSAAPSLPGFERAAEFRL